MRTLFPMTTTATAATGAPEIRVRRMDFGFDAMPEHWFDDNPFLSSLLAALSVSFPPGERYFIRSVLHYLPRITDERLRAEIRAFVGQEGNHTKEHLAFNRFLDAKGLPATAMEQFVGRLVNEDRELLRVFELGQHANAAPFRDAERSVQALFVEQLDAETVDHCLHLGQLVPWFAANRGEFGQGLAVRLGDVEDISHLEAEQPLRRRCRAMRAALRGS